MPDEGAGQKKGGGKSGEKTTPTQCAMLRWGGYQAFCVTGVACSAEASS